MPENLTGNQLRHIINKIKINGDIINILGANNSHNISLSRNNKVIKQFCKVLKTNHGTKATLNIHINNSTISNVSGLLRYIAQKIQELFPNYFVSFNIRQNRNSRNNTGLITCNNITSKVGFGNRKIIIIGNYNENELSIKYYKYDDFDVDKLSDDNKLKVVNSETGPQNTKQMNYNKLISALEEMLENE